MRNASLAAVIALLALGGCSAPDAQPAAPAQPELPAVEVVHPSRGDMTRALVVPGDLVGFSEAALYAKVTGYLQQIDVDKGDWVKKGQRLAVIEVPELQQKLNRARASRDVERVTYDRLKQVWSSDSRLVAREDVDIARGKFDQAEADVEELEAMVGYTQISAPFDGVVTARYVDPGALIEADGHGSASPSGQAAERGKSPVVTLADISTLRVYVYVPEDASSLVRRGMPATLRLREFPGREFTGTVARFSHALDLSTRTMLTEVDIPNPARELYPGMYADVSLELQRHEGVLEIPATAVGSATSDPFVFVVRDGALAKVPVTLGLTNPERVEVVSGLSPEDDVVRNQSPWQRDGEKARPVAAGDAAQVAERTG